MSFYGELAKHYEQVFPPSAEQTEFISKLNKKGTSHNLLDMGCGSGAFAASMAAHLEQVEAFDLDTEMVSLAKSKYKAENLRFQPGNMLQIAQLYAGMSFDLITCFGNTLVHLPQKDAAKVIEQVSTLLNPGGCFILQILNYEYIFTENITALPLIETGSLRFERSYELKSRKEISFNTRITLNSENKTLNNSTPLYPLFKQELRNMLLDRGFIEAHFYQNFYGEAYTGQHIPLILSAVKTKTAVL